MSTTLTNGLKLPDKGSVDWYADMQSNYAILDNSVGTVAEHTSALAGKAPLVHTHTKNDITDFPAYGTTAGTICEGNDSRLSDARTPVAHTHTKSDVTDLFNSANTWSEDNTFNNIKSKGLTLTNNGRIYTEVPSLTKGTLPSSTYYYSIKNDYALDSSSASNRINQKRCYVETNGTNAVEWNLTAWGTTNIAVLRLSIAADGTNKTYLLGADTIPGINNTYNLGNSTAKWKTINGVNPGALSFPSSESADYIDLSSNLSTNAEYQYTAPYDGWLCLYVIVNEFFEENAIGLYRSDTLANSHQWAKSVTAALHLYKQNKYQGSVMLPVESGKKYICYISLNANTTIHNKLLFFYKNKGNV